MTRKITRWFRLNRLEIAMSACTAVLIAAFSAISAALTNADKGEYILILILALYLCKAAVGVNIRRRAKGPVSAYLSITGIICSIAVIAAAVIWAWPYGNTSLAGLLICGGMLFHIGELLAMEWLEINRRHR